MVLITSLAEATTENMSGGKAAALGTLMRAGFRVPPGFVITGMQERLGAAVHSEILSNYDALGARFVAVRSSAIGEDGAADAWAGQLETYLNVTRDSLLQRVDECMQSARSERARAYAAQKI